MVGGRENWRCPLRVVVSASECRPVSDRESRNGRRPLASPLGLSAHRRPMPADQSKMRPDAPRGSVQVVKAVLAVPRLSFCSTADLGKPVSRSGPCSRAPSNGIPFPLTQMRCIIEKRRASATINLLLPTSARLLHRPRLQARPLLNPVVFVEADVMLHPSSPSQVSHMAPAA